ncbi:hypothetical protein ACFWMR_17345 [Amycolatopsis thailandensis]|uniref:hypothetical protein n=1 Tax=Amycolatopsis thailandensis TaxID=589330 RepID=UPI00364AB8A2
MEFVVAEDEVWLSAFGVLPHTEAVSGDHLVREVRLPLSESEELHVTWDLTAWSVRVQYSRASDVIVDVYREQVSLVTIDDHRSGPVLEVDYHAEGGRGRMSVRTRPAFALADTFVRT